MPGGERCWPATVPLLFPLENITIHFANMIMIRRFYVNLSYFHRITPTDQLLPILLGTSFANFPTNVATNHSLGDNFPGSLSSLVACYSQGIGGTAAKI